MATSHYFTTDDGVQLHYRHAGKDNDEVLVLLPGLAATVNQFASQIDVFAATHRVIALDLRGQGDSDKPDSGYRVARLAKDVLNLLDHLQVDKVHVLGQSTGCAIIWIFVELFGQDRFQSIILVDQMACYLKQPEWSEVECRSYGAIATAEEMRLVKSKLLGPDGKAVMVQQLHSHLASSDDVPMEEMEQFEKDVLKMPPQAAAKLGWDVVSADYRDILPHITVPTLCIGGSHSIVPPECMPWIASEMENAQDTVLEGSHLMFLEDSGAFNLTVYDFLMAQQQSTSKQTTGEESSDPA